MSTPQKICRMCGHSRPASEDFCPVCTTPKIPRPPRERSSTATVDTGLETRWGGGPKNPTIEEMRAALAELDTPDEEHPSTWLVDDDEWIVDVYESGLVIFSQGEKELCRRKNVQRKDVLELWMLLQQGRRDEIIHRLSV